MSSQNELKLESNVTSIVFDKRIPTMIENKGEWDFLTLYKTLLYTQYHNEVPKKIGRKLLSKYGLNIRETKNYMNEMIDLEKFFMVRFNKIKDMKLRLESLKFIKNGVYKQKVEELQQYKNEIEHNFAVDEMEYLDHKYELTKEDKEKINRYDFLQKEIARYENKIIGKEYEVIRILKRIERKRKTNLEKIEEMNKQFNKNGTIDAKYKLKKIVLEKPFEYEEVNKDDLQLKSKMIYHLKRFLNISNREASKLLENNLFDNVINVDLNEANEKLAMINYELDTYTDIVNFLTNLKNKTFVCPHCTYTNNLGSNLNLHMNTYHKNKEYKNQILIIEPFLKNDKWVSAYDNFSSENKHIVLHHIKNLHILKSETQSNNIQLPSNVRNSMVDRDITIDIRKVPGMIKDETIIKSNLINIEKEKDPLIIKHTAEEQKQKLEHYIQSLSIISFFKKHNVEIYNNILNQVENMIEEAKHFHNINNAYRWINSFIGNFFMKFYMKELNDIKVFIEYNDNHQIITYENVHNITKTIPKTVTINSKPLIENYKFVDDDKNVEISRDLLIKKIKTEIMMVKVDMFLSLLLDKTRDKLNPSKVGHFASEVKSIFPKLFRKIIDHKVSVKREYDTNFPKYKDSYENFGQLFDGIVEKFKIMNTDNIQDLLIHDTDKISKDLDDILYYILLSFLPNDDEAVVHTYNLLEENGSEEVSDFKYKNWVWEWNRKYKGTNETSNFKNITKDDILDELFPQDTQNSLPRSIKNYQQRNKYIFEEMDFSKYDKRGLFNKREENKIEEFILTLLKKQSISTIDYRVFSTLIFVKKLTKAIETKKRQVRNPFMVYKFLRILDINIERPKIYKKIKTDYAVSRRLRRQQPVSNIDKQEDEERKEDLLNDFMNLTEDSMQEENLRNEHNIPNLDNNELDENDFFIPDDVNEEDFDEENQQEDYGDVEEESVEDSFDDLF